MHLKNASRYSLLLLFLISCSSARETVDFTLIHWNDFHAANVPYEIRKSKSPNENLYRVGGSAYLKAYLDSLRRVHPNPILVFAGDDFQGSPISGFTRGQSQIDLMVRLGPDVLTPGNHEFDYGEYHLMEMLSKTRLNYISANLYRKNADTTIFPPYWIRTVDGVTIAFIGGTTDELDRLCLPINIAELYTKPLKQELRRTVDALKKSHPDIAVWIAVTHAGFEVDTALARQIPEFDLIIGSHTHTILSHAVTIGKTHIVQAGSRGRFVGEVRMQYNKKAKRLESINCKLIETINAGITPDSAVAAVVEKQESILGKQLDQVIGELKVDWKLPRDFRESAIGNFETDRFREYFNADIAFMNNGGFRRELPAGPVRLRDIWEINPFNNSMVGIYVTGDQIVPMLEYALKNSESSLQASGIRYTVRRNGSNDYRVTEITVNGQPIEAGRRYHVVMNNYMGMHLENIFGLSKENHELNDYGISDRDIIIDAIQKIKVIDQGLDGRVRVEP